MLDTIDTLVGFVVVMLVVSMAVTTLTASLTTAFNLRGVGLRQGVANLLALLDNGLRTDQAKRIADHLLRNPLIGRPVLLLGNLRIGALRLNAFRLADTVHREELTKLILDFAMHGDADKATDPQYDLSGADEDALRARLLRSLKANGISDPEATLRDARDLALALERTSPELGTAVRQNMALLAAAQSEFLAKMHGWFDQTIDRVTDLFTLRARFVTTLSAVLIALVTQLDTITLLNRLQQDRGLRDELVQEAVRHPEKFQPRAPTPAPIGSAADRPADLDERAAQVSAALATIRNDPELNKVADRDLIDMPASPDDWRQRFEESANPWLHLLGILLSAALLSLGAPFWFSTLENLLKLRSIVGKRDDAERAERQSTQSAPPGSPNGGAAPVRVVVRDGTDAAH